MLPPGGSDKHPRDADLTQGFIYLKISSSYSSFSSSSSEKTVVRAVLATSGRGLLYVALCCPPNGMCPPRTDRDSTRLKAHTHAHTGVLVAWCDSAPRSVAASVVVSLSVLKKKKI